MGYLSVGLVVFTVGLGGVGDGFALLLLGCGCIPGGVLVLILTSTFGVCFRAGTLSRQPFLSVASAIRSVHVNRVGLFVHK